MEPFSLPIVAVLGLTFKADVDDLRQSPALAIAEQVAAAAPHARVLVAEPHAKELPATLIRTCSRGAASSTPRGSGAPESPS